MIFPVAKDRFISETLGVDDENKEISNNGVFLSAGRSNRDYDWLINNWPSDREIEIVCDVFKGSYNNENIHIINNCYGQDYFEKLAKCKAVIIPLKDDKISSGQLVIIQAMMLGKPIVVTSNESIKEYINNGFTGYIIPKSNQALLDAILKLDNSDVYRVLSQNARRTYLNKYSMYQMGLRIGRIISARINS